MKLFDTNAIIGGMLGSSSKEEEDVDKNNSKFEDNGISKDIAKSLGIFFLILVGILIIMILILLIKKFVTKNSICYKPYKFIEMKIFLNSLLR